MEVIHMDTNRRTLSLISEDCNGKFTNYGQVNCSPDLLSNGKKKGNSILGIAFLFESQCYLRRCVCDGGYESVYARIPDHQSLILLSQGIHQQNTGNLIFFSSRHYENKILLTITQPIFWIVKLK